MATAHLICGYIGAGKTTFALRLEQQLPAIRFTSDEWINRLYSEDEADIGNFQEYLHRVESLMRPIWCQCLCLGIDVVLDMGFWSRGHRDAVRGDVHACGATSRLYYLRCDDETAWQRIEQRNLDPQLSIRMVPNTFDVLKKHIEPLGPDEEYVVIDT